MYKLFKLIKKDFKLLFYKKTSLIGIIFGPLLLILLVGLAFNNSSMYQITIGYHFFNETDLILDTLSGLDKKDFTMVKFDSRDDCIDSVKERTTNICLDFSKNFTITNKMDNIIHIYVDNSDYNLAWMVLDTVSKHVSSTSSNVTFDLTKAMLDRIQESRNILEKDLIKLDVSIDKADRIKTNLKDIKSKIKTQILDFDTDNFKTDDIKKSESKNKDLFTALVKNITNDLENIVDELDNIDNKSQYDKEAIDIADDAIDFLKDIDRDYKEESGDIRKALAKTETYISKLGSNLEKARKLNEESLEIIEESLKVNENQTSHILQVSADANKILAKYSSLEVRDASSITNPIQTSIHPLTSEKTYFSFMFPSMVNLFLMLIGILLSSILVLREKKSTAFLRNFIAPINKAYFLTATYFTSLILVSVQLIVILLISEFVLELGIFTNFGSLLLILFLSTSFYILFGMALGYIFNTEESVTLASICFTSIFLLLSGIILPLESMHPTIRSLTDYNPFLVSVNLFKKIMIHGFNLSSFGKEMKLMLLYIFVLLFISLLLIKWMKKSYIIRIGFKKEQKKKN